MEDTLSSSSESIESEVLIDDDDFRLVKEKGVVVARQVSAGVLSLLSGFFARSIVVCVLYLAVVVIWWLADTCNDDHRKCGEIILDSETALEAAAVGVIAIAILFIVSFVFFHIDRRRRLAAAAGWNWKLESGSRWFYGPHDEPLVAAREADIHLSYEIVGRAIYLYRFHLKKDDYKILLFESSGFKPTIKFVKLLDEFGFPGASGWEKLIRKVERQ